MTKINTLTVEGNKTRGYTVTAMTDYGTLLDIKEGFEFISAEEYDMVVDASIGNNANAEWLRGELATSRAQRDVECKLLADRLRSAYGDIDRLHVEIGQLQQQLAAKPAEPTPGLHAEHQNIPVGRTIDTLAPLDALASAPKLDEPAEERPELCPDAPARPPGYGEMARTYVTQAQRLVDPAEGSLAASYDYAGRTGYDDEGLPTDEI